MAANEPTQGPQLVPAEPPAFDLDKIIAEREPKQPFRFVFGGDEYSLPPNPDLTAMALLTDPTTTRQGLAKLLGEEQWERLVSSEAILDVPALNALLEAYQDHVGDLGESKASARSSKATAKK